MAETAATAVDQGVTHDVTRPLPRKAEYGTFLHSERPEIAKKALGTIQRKAGEPATACEFCWPQLVASTYYDASGRACCAQCAGNPDRIARLPRVRMPSWGSL